MKRLVSGFLPDGFKEERVQLFCASACGNKAETRGQAVRASSFRVLESVLDFPDSKWTLSLVCVAMLCLTTGFVHAPFPQWALGEVIEINPEETRLVIQEDSSKTTLSLRWNKKTRLWIEPTRRNDGGIAFEPKNLTLGAPVRIMFKRYSDYNLVTRVIRLASPKNAS